MRQLSADTVHRLRGSRINARIALNKKKPLFGDRFFTVRNASIRERPETEERQQNRDAGA